MNPKTIAGISSFSVAIFCLLIYVKGRRGSRKKSPKSAKGDRNTVVNGVNDSLTRHISEDDIWNTAIFFPDFFPENEDTKTRNLIWYLEQATSTLDVCVYGFAFPMFGDTLINLASKKGVKVRVLSNRLTPANRRFMRAGIRTRAKIHIWRNQLAPDMFRDLMHHKYVVIDKTAVLAGSLNWTWPSVTENWENVMITTQPRIVSRLSEEFERLWEESSPNTGRSSSKAKKILSELSSD